MQHKIRSSALALGLGLTTTLLSGVTSAAGLDGKANLICAAIDVVGCENRSGCLEGQAQDFELPDFLFVDIEKKQIRATDEAGYKEVSPIKNFEQTEKQMILQGVEKQQLGGWTATINLQTGRVILSSAGPDVSFMVFGVCTAL